MYRNLRNACLVLCAAPLLVAAEKGAPAPAFVTLDALQVPIIDGARTEGSLNVKIVVQAKDAESATRLAAAMPVLRSATLATTLEFGRLYASPMMPVDATRLSGDLTHALKAQDAGVDRVLLVEVMARRA